MKSKHSSPLFKIGVQKYDFLSHAWLEIDGKVVGDDNNIRDHLKVILKI